MGAEVPSPVDIVEMDALPRIGERVYVPSDLPSPHYGYQIPLKVIKVDWLLFAEQEYNVQVELGECNG